MKINKAGGYGKSPGQRRQWLSKEGETRRKINKLGRYLGDRIKRTPLDMGTREVREMLQGLACN